jgi:hypothetical protein
MEFVMENNQSSQIHLAPGEIAFISPNANTTESGIVLPSEDISLDGLDVPRATMHLLFSMQALQVYDILYLSSDLNVSNKWFYWDDLTYSGVRIITSLTLVGGAPATALIRAGIAYCSSNTGREPLVWSSVPNGTLGNVYFPKTSISVSPGLVAYIQNIAGSSYYVTGTASVYDSTT